MTSRCEHRRSTDGKHLVVIMFERESPEADSPVIEVIYDVQFPMNVRGDSIPVLRPLTATRTDTRVAITLTDEEDSYCVGRASEKAMELAKDL